jgi:restriction system protein
MALPKNHELVRPFLELLADGRSYRLRDIADAIARKLSLSEGDLAETASNGSSRLTDRLGWVKCGLANAGLVETVERGAYQITDFGLAELQRLPQTINSSFLQQYGKNGAEGEAALQQGATGILEAANVPDVLIEEPPEERIDAAFRELEAALAEELLAYLQALSPSGFERFVVHLIKAMGYGTEGAATKQSGDGGIDGIIYGDPLHLERTYIQAKRWAENNKVSSPDINGFIGALMRQGATRGVFVTTSQYTPDAIKAAKDAQLRLKLIDGLELVKLAIKFKVGVSRRRVLEIKRLDSDFFDEI